MKIIIVTLASFVLFGCSDAEKSAFNALGKPRKVTCFSGGKIILEDTTTGKLENEEHSNGFYFNSAKTGKLVEVEADCIIETL